MHCRRLTFGIGVVFFTLLCGIGQAQERSEANQDSSPQKTASSKQNEQRSRQEKEIETAAFRFLLTDPPMTSDIQSETLSKYVFVLSVQENDRTDLRFLKDLHLSKMVVRRFTEITMEVVYPDSDSKRLDMGGSLEYRDKVPGMGVIIISLDRVEWISDDAAEIHWFASPIPHYGRMGTYELVRKHGKWSVRGIKKGSEFRA